MYVFGQAWCQIPIIPPEQEDSCKFKVSLDYMTPLLKRKTNTTHLLYKGDKISNTMLGTCSRDGVFWKHKMTDSEMMDVRHKHFTS